MSISVLEYLLVESKRANSIGIDVEACGCVLRHTHGLPCAHEIADYIRQDRPIPLELALLLSTSKYSNAEIDTFPRSSLN